MLTWTDEGIHKIEFLDSKFDLVEVREPMRLKVWAKDGIDPILCAKNDPRAVGENSPSGYTLKEFVEVMP
jgi:hypothetical protein